MDNVSYVTADIGQASSGGFGGPSAITSNAVSFSLVLDKERTKTSIDIAQDIREEYATFPNGKVTISEGTSGPPAGADLQINLFGDDLSVLDQQADKIIAYLKTQKGTTDVSKSIKPGTSKIVFVPNQASMTQYGVTNEQIGLSLRTFATGFTLDTAKLDTGDITNNEKQDITLRLSSGLQNIQDLSSVTIATARGGIPLNSLGKLELRPNPTLISREDGERTISVTAGVQKGFTTTTLNADLEKFAQSDLKLPDGYSWKTGGVNEENQKSVNSILQAMLISFLLIIVTMVIQFGSFRKAVIVMLVIPLSISGVFIIFSLTQTPLSFPALIGVLALFGIVVKNSILIIDKISANEKIGMDFVDGIVDGASSRLEPIALTSLAAIMGLIPITISDPLWRGLGGAIIAGLTFSGTIMLFFIPVVYYAWFSSKLSKKRAKKS
jgi:HAE1 family hydrophobic/amphiphilic exporter-1